MFTVCVVGILANACSFFFPGNPFIPNKDLNDSQKTVRVILTLVPFIIILLYVLIKNGQVK